MGSLSAAAARAQESPYLHGVTLFCDGPLPGVVIYDRDSVLPGHHLHGWLSAHKGIPSLHHDATLEAQRQGASQKGRQQSLAQPTLTGGRAEHMRSLPEPVPTGHGEVRNPDP